MSKAKSSTESIAVLYQEHHGWLHHWLCKKTGCPEQAADVAHDSFFRLFAFIGLDSLREPRAFLTTTASRLLIDAARRRKVEQAYLETYAYHYGELAEAPSAEHLAMITETLLVISRMLEGLPDKCRQAFMMARLDGMKHAEIAQELNVSSHSVKKYIASAMLHCYRVTRDDRLLDH